MGENPERVFNYGMAGLDNLYKTKLLPKEELEKRLNFKFDKKVAVCTYHPVTLENNTAEEQIANLLEAIRQFDMKVIFTKTNADINGRIIDKKIKQFVNNNLGRYIYVENLGQLKYLSVLKYANLMIGNSSSGLLEAPSFKLPVVNIGDRQKGRVKADNIIDCSYSKKEIINSINQAISDDFKNKINNTINPYDKYMDGQTSFKIKEKLKELDLNKDVLKKTFYDLNF